MAKAKETKPAVEKSPKTIKVSTVVISVLVLLGLIAAFIGGIAYNENYNSTVRAEAQAIVTELKSQDQQ